MTWLCALASIVPALAPARSFTRETYPSNEVDRPLNLTGKIIEGRVDIQTDISDGSTFKTFILRVGGRYGLLDTLELDAGFDLTLAAKEGLSKPKDIFVAAQLSLVDDVVAGRLAIILPVDPDLLFDVALGFPLKIRIIPGRLAIEALEQIVVIHFAKPEGVEDTPRPNIVVSVGGVLQIVDNLALRLRGEVQFDLDDADRSIIPVALELQYTPINLFDFGIFVALDNLKGSGEEKAFDRRSIGLFARARY